MASLAIRATLRSATRSVARSALINRAVATPVLTSLSSTGNFKTEEQFPVRSGGVAFFSSNDDSHSDFAPKRAVVEGEDEAIAMIREHVRDNRVMLYMKGNPSQPQCGFSARVVQILQKEGVDFSSVNVLDYPSIREGVKQFSDWPTIPQVYVNGEFIGGCDIVTSMHESGELAEMLKEGAEN